MIKKHVRAKSTGQTIDIAGKRITVGLEAIGQRKGESSKKVIEVLRKAAREKVFPQLPISTAP